MHRSSGLTMTSSYRAPKFTTHSASSNLHTSVSIAHRYTHLPSYNLDKTSQYSVHNTGHTQAAMTAPNKCSHRGSRPRHDPGPPPGPSQPAWSRLGATPGSPGLQSRTHCQTRQPGRMRRPARSLSARRACRRWRPTRSTHTTGAGARAGTVAGAHNTRAATVEGRHGHSRPPTALPQRPTRRAVAATRQH